MRHATILIDLGEKSFSKMDPQSAEAEKGRLLAWRNFMRGQLLAVASRLNDAGQDQPLLVAQKNDPLLEKARDMGLPALPHGNPLAGFRLWRWQKKRPLLNIIAAGETSLQLACKLARKRPPGSTRLFGLFWLPCSGQNTLLSRLDAAICFSRTALDSLAENMRKPVFCLPGMETGSRPVRSRNEARESNFVFGMAESLAVASGALSVARAMAAIWQIEGLPPWEARLFGSGSRFSLIIEEARNLGVLSRLAVLDEQPLGYSARLCDAWIAPGHSPLESPPALWAGVEAELPVLAAATPQHQAWLPSEAALWFAPQSPQALGAMMIEIMKNGALAEDLSRKSARWKEEITLAAMTERLLAIIAASPD